MCDLFAGVNKDDFIKIFVLEDSSKSTSIGEYKGTVSWVHQQLCLSLKLQPQTLNIRIIIKVFNTSPTEFWKLDNLEICGIPKPSVCPWFGAILLHMGFFFVHCCRRCTKLYREDFDRPEIQGKGLFPSGENLYDPTHNFWLTRGGANNFESNSFFKIWNGKLVAHNIGKSTRPSNGVWFKTPWLDVSYLQKIEVAFWLWKTGVYLFLHYSSNFAFLSRRYVS